MHHKNIYDLMNLFFADGFTIENLVKLQVFQANLLDDASTEIISHMKKH